MTREEQYLAKIAGEETDIPSKPILRSEQYFAKIAGENVEIPQKPLLNEEIYLAILTGESYDIPAPYNRIEQYMAKACGAEIEVPTPITRVEQLWAQIAEGGSWTDTEITGTLPLIFNSRAAVALKNYRIYGTSEGAGVETENLFDKDAKDTSKGYASGKILLSDGSEDDSNGYYISEYIDISNLTSDKITTYVGTILNIPSLCFYDENKNYISGTNYGGKTAKTYTIPSNAKYCRFTVITTVAYSSITMLVEGSTAPTSYIPFGYKIPILNTSGVTENLWNYTAQPLSGQGYLYNGSINLPAGTYTLRADLISGNANMSFAVVDNQGNTVFNTSIYNHGSRTFMSDYDITQLRFYVNSTIDELYLTLVQGSTAPDHYIPHRYTSNYDLFIGDSKLYEEEYLDYAEQKIYKDVSGTLTPTDPPAPLPAIQAYQGENTLSSTETVGEVTIKGKIKEAVPNG